MRVARHPPYRSPVRVLTSENSTRGAIGVRNPSGNGPEEGYPGGENRLGYHCLGLSPRVKETTAKESGPGWKRSENEGQQVTPEPSHAGALALEWEGSAPYWYKRRAVRIADN